MSVRERACRTLLLAGVVLFLGTACSAPPPEFRPTATVKDLMDSLVDPSADFLWDSVEVVATLKGTDHKAPKTDEDWNAVRRHAVALVEASNLLLVPGRRIAQPGEQAGDPKIDLQPDAIEALVKQNRASWTMFAHGLHDAALESLKAIDARDAKALLYAGAALDEACERCHSKFWYPSLASPPRQDPQGKKNEADEK